MQRFQIVNTQGLRLVLCSRIFLGGRCRQSMSWADAGSHRVVPTEWAKGVMMDQVPHTHDAIMESTSWDGTLSENGDTT